MFLDTATQGRGFHLDDQNNVEFAREKELLFEKWLTSQRVTKMFNKLSYNVINPFDEFKQ